MYPNIYFLYATSKYTFLYPIQMKKTLLGGLAAIIMSCGPPPAASVPEIKPLTHRGVKVTGIIYRDIQIIGPEDYTNMMMGSLDRLAINTPAFWNFVHQHITTIRFNPPSRVLLKDGIFDTDDNLTTSQKYQPDAWIDSELVHEACHVDQYKTGRPSFGYEAEKECMEWQNMYFRYIGATNMIIDLDKMLAKHHWEVKPEDQWW